MSDENKKQEKAEPQDERLNSADYDVSFKLLEELIQHNLKLNEQLLIQFQEKIVYDAAKEKAFDKIYEELKIYKEKFLIYFQKPLFIDLVLLLDNIQRMVLIPQQQGHVSEDTMLLKIEAELLEILYRRDIIPYDVEQSYYQPGLHKAVRTIPTDKETENNMIVEVLRKGFMAGERVFRPAEVIIKKFESTVEEKVDKSIMTVL